MPVTLAGQTFGVGVFRDDYETLILGHQANAVRGSKFMRTFAVRGIVRDLDYQSNSAGAH